MNEQLSGRLRDNIRLIVINGISGTQLFSMELGDWNILDFDSQQYIGQAIAEGLPDTAYKPVDVAEPYAELPRYTRVRDTRTNIMYESKTKAGAAVAAEYGFDPSNNFAWYLILKEDPTRFELIY